MAEKYKPQYYKAFNKKDYSLDNNDDTDSGELLKKKGIYYITDEIDQDDLKEIHQNIIAKHLDTKWQDDIQIIVNSVGGLCSEAWMLIDLLDWVRMDVKTTGMGQVCSAGAMLLSSGTIGKRVITKNTTIMIHGFSTGMYGNYHDLVSEMKACKDEHLRELDFWVEKSKYKTRQEVERHLITGKDIWLTAKEAINHGIVDIIAGEAHTPISQQTKQQPNNNRRRRNRGKK